MRIDKIVLTDFRNYDRLVWAPQSRIVVLTGKNGAGKTNLLEAISLLAPGRGLRNAPNASIQRSGTVGWGVVATLAHQTSSVTLATGSDTVNPARRVFRRDGEVIRTHGEIAGLFSCVWLTPHMDRLFTDPTSGRRRFLDRLVLALHPDHARETASHERAVMQRNRLLASQGNQRVWLSGLEDSIARHAVALTATRMAFVNSMNEGSSHAQGAFPAARLRLLCPIADQLSVRPALAVEDYLRACLEQARSADRERGMTGLGAHRADFLLEDAVTGRQAALSSSGQQKAMLIHVMLAHAALAARQSVVPPAILLDEPLVHLDLPRREAFLDSIRQNALSVVLTGTDSDQFSHLGGEAERLHVSEGRIWH